MAHFIEEINKELAKNQEHDDMFSKIVHAAASTMIWLIGSQPEVEARKIVPASWIPSEDETGEGSNTYTCSNCGEVFYFEYGDAKENNYHFCPKCGAKMDKGWEDLQ